VGDDREIARSLKSLLVPVPKADPMVDHWRRKGDWSREVGVPAHLTLAGPFRLSDELPMRPLEEIAVRVKGTPFTLDEFGRLGDAICLLLSEEDPLLRIRREVMKSIGRPHPGLGQKFHLTIRRGGSEVDVTTMRAELEPLLPLRCEVEDVLVATYDEGHLALVSLVDAASGRSYVKEHL
jgi:2'-5' RNA ligase superfamily protein